MPHSRPISLSLAVGLLAAALAGAQPAAAQDDFFDWLNGSPAKPKEETFKGEVPEPVQRDNLPDLSPPPTAVAPDAAPPRGQGQNQNTSGEPIPRGPDGAAYDRDSRPVDNAAGGNSQFDPLESRRSRYQGTAATPSKSEWKNPDAVAPAKAERYAPGSYEDNQSPESSRDGNRGRDDEEPPRDSRQGMTAPPRDQQQYDGGAC